MRKKKIKENNRMEEPQNIKKKVYLFNQRPVKVKYLIKPSDTITPRYLYTYKGVPGGWY